MVALLTKEGFFLEQKPSQRFVVMKQSVILDENLTPTEKLIYARICTFDQFFEASQTTAELFGVKTDTVQKAKAKLEKLGYILCVKNTGRGKVYEPVFDRPDPHESTQTVTNCPARPAQTSDSDPRIHAPIEKKEKRVINVSKETLANAPDEFGNQNINEMLHLWQDAGLPAITSRVQSSRRTIWNMLRNKSIGAERLKRGIELAGEAYGEPYAPTVFNFEDLNRKLTALEAWKQKQAVLAEKPNPQPSSSSYSPTYSGEIAYEHRAYDQRPSILDQKKVTEVFSDDFYEEMRQRARGKRKEQNNEQQ